MKPKAVLCERIKARISDLKDRGLALDPETEAHVASCARCSSFFNYISRLGTLITRAVYPRIELMEPPSFTFREIPGKKKKPVIKTAIAWGVPIAAVLAVCIVGAIFIIRISDSQYMAKETKVFVESLMEQPVLLDSETVKPGTGMLNDSFFDDTVLGKDYNAPMVELSELFIE
jgi:hypothetical protein